MASTSENGFGPREFGERVERAAADADVRTLTGFALGRSTGEGRWRLYLNAELTHFVECDRADVVHAEETRPGHTIVWVRRDARITESTSRTLPVEFLQGEVRTGFLRGLSGLTGVRALAAEGCPCSGCAHCTQSCSSLPGGDSVGLSCGC
ncbi:hypothetical protein [Streptomyces sp. NPDC047974]|uniref:hypothetical protein n=1 Tax=Streptomyces sp. NPDC047974 TaxID=3154343 RepID=UPI003406A789